MPALSNASSEFSSLWIPPMGGNAEALGVHRILTYRRDGYKTAKAATDFHGLNVFALS